MNHIHFKNVHGWYLNIILYKCIKNDFANLVNNCFHFQKNQLSKLFTPRELPDSFLSNVHENITIVTAYWDLGTFRKGKKKQRTRHHYEKWASIFEMILNPVIVYTDSSVFQSSMENYRSKFTNKTMIYCVNRTTFWPFQLTEQIKAVFDQPNYPKFYPNTFVPEYSASQHMKFAVMLDAVQKNLSRHRCIRGLMLDISETLWMTNGIFGSYRLQVLMKAD